MKAIIIDDEPKARRMLEALLKEYCPDIQVVASEENVPDGVLAIRKQGPDVVFLDIEMPGYTGFQLLDFFTEIPFEIIFTTAHSGYAMQAFQVSAIDYLMKPLQISELEKAVERLRKIKGVQLQERMEVLKDNFRENKIRKIALPVSDGLLFVEVKDISHLEADGSYTHVHLSDKRKIMVSKKIKDFEVLLTSHNSFFRPHRSYIINLQKIVKYYRQDGGHIEMDNGVEIPLAREKKDDFLEVIKDMSL